MRLCLCRFVARNEGVITFPPHKRVENDGRQARYLRDALVFFLNEAGRTNAAHVGLKPPLIGQHIGTAAGVECPGHL